MITDRVRPLCILIIADCRRACSRRRFRRLCTGSQEQACEAPLRQPCKGAVASGLSSHRPTAAAAGPLRSSGSNSFIDWRARGPPVSQIDATTLFSARASPSERAAATYAPFSRRFTECRFADWTEAPPARLRPPTSAIPDLPCAFPLHPAAVGGALAAVHRPQSRWAGPQAPDRRHRRAVRAPSTLTPPSPRAHPAPSHPEPPLPLGPPPAAPSPAPPARRPRSTARRRMPSASPPSRSPSGPSATSAAGSRMSSATRSSATSSSTTASTARCWRS